MFLRSAKNAEFDVPKQYVDDAVGYVDRCWDPQMGVFFYKNAGSERRWSRGMVGAGILSLAMAGQHDKPIAQRAGDWLLTNPFRGFGEKVGQRRPLLLQHVLLQPGDGPTRRAALEAIFSEPRGRAGAKSAVDRLMAPGAKRL